jgi:hypothetical protein
MIDVGRLPPSVQSFSALVDHLRAVKKQIAERPSGVETADWDVAKRGDLKLYKLFICAIHATHAYLTKEADVALDRPLATVAQDIITAAPGNAPEGLSKGGQDLWTATFSGAVPRTSSCVKALLFLLHKDSSMQETEDDDDDNQDDDDDNSNGGDPTQPLTIEEQPDEETPVAPVL